MGTFLRVLGLRDVARHFEGYVIPSAVLLKGCTDSELMQLRQRLEKVQEIRADQPALMAFSVRKRGRDLTYQLGLLVLIPAALKKAKNNEHPGAYFGLSPSALHIGHLVSAAELGLPAAAVPLLLRHLRLARPHLGIRPHRPAAGLRPSDGARLAGRRPGSGGLHPVRAVARQGARRAAPAALDDRPAGVAGAGAYL